MREIWYRMNDRFWALASHFWWMGRSLRARIVCWYIERIWMPRQPEIVFSVVEQQEALAITNEILQKLGAEEQQCSR